MSLSPEGVPACDWADGFAVDGLNGPVHALAVWDDGGGPAVCAGGQFSVAGKVAASNIACWRGSAWRPLVGPLGNGVNDDVRALAVWDDGSGPALYAAGFFTAAGGVPAGFVARWNGFGWSGVGGGVDDGVRALAVWDDGSGPALYAGGFFVHAGGAPANHVARWDGAAWSALVDGAADGVDGAVHALLPHADAIGPALWVGGDFLTAGALTANRVARWSGTFWSSLTGPSGTGVSGPVSVLAPYDDGTGPTVYVGGHFRLAGSLVVNHVARWDGESWAPLPGPLDVGVSGPVQALAVHDDGGGEALFVGGYFDQAGGSSASGVARWDGAGWSTSGGVYGPAEVSALLDVDDQNGGALVAAGPFTWAGNAPAQRVARWAGGEWSPLGLPPTNGMSDRVSALAVFDDGGGNQLYAGGRFWYSGCSRGLGLARWNGVSWSTPEPHEGNRLGGYLYGLAVHDGGNGPALYVGGTVWLGDPTAYQVAGWDGRTWTALPRFAYTWSDPYVWALASFDPGSGPELYAGGLFQSAGGAPVNHIARWDGGSWLPLAGPGGVGVDNEVYALAVYDDGGGPDLYAGGMFLTAGGVTVNRVARWDGSSWSALTGPSGTGTSGTVTALAVWDDGGGPALYVGGSFVAAGGTTVNSVARWDGVAWSALVGPAATGVGSGVKALTVHDLGDGPRLFVGGSFSYAGGLEVEGLAQWDGWSWSPVAGTSGVGVDGEVLALSGFHDGTGPTLYVGGDFTVAGGLPSSRVAAFRCNPAPLLADGFGCGTTGAWSAVEP